MFETEILDVVETDVPRVSFLLERAAEGVHTDSPTKLGFIYKESMHDCEKNINRYLWYLLRATLLGHFGVIASLYTFPHAQAPLRCLSQSASIDSQKYNMTGFFDFEAAACPSYHDVNDTGYLRRRVAPARLPFLRSASTVRASSDLATTKLTMAAFQLSFDSFESLQQQLVLLPRIEEEGVGAVVHSFLPNSQKEGDEARDETLVVQGSVLLALFDDDETNVVDLRDQEFAHILAVIRKAPSRPIVLQFEKPSTIEVVGEEKKTEDEHQSTLLSPSATHVANNMQQSLLSWSSRMRDSATKAASKVAEAAKERSKTMQHVPSLSAGSVDTLSISSSGGDVEGPEKPQSLQIFRQCAVTGSFLPLAQHARHRIELSNASLLSLRISPTEPAPSHTVVQWYRSTSQEEEWVALPQANHPSFQPSATEVGLRLRCIYRIYPGPTLQDNDASKDVPGSNRDTPSFEKGVCETDVPVQAAISLFNGARQALVRGAHFGGIVGRGNAQGRRFRLDVRMANTQNAETKERAVASAITIYQVSGDVAEPIHPLEEPIVCVSATADHSSARNLDIVFRGGLPQSATMVEALSTHGHFELEAPNRLARESILLAIGIANYGGKPKDLTPETILYDSPTSVPDNILPSGSWERAQDEAKCSNNESNVGASDNDDDVSLNNQGSAPPRTPPRAPPRTPLKPTPTQVATPLTQAYALVRSTSLDTRQLQVEGKSQDAELLQELQELRAKLSRKDKIVNELQRQIAQSEGTCSILERRLDDCKSDLKASKNESKRLTLDVRKAAETEARRQQEADSAQQRSDTLKSRIQELEKANLNLQNEKAVLVATVEAREGRLSKMSELVESHEKLMTRVANQDTLEKELDTSKARIASLTDNLVRQKEEERETQQLLAASRQETLDVQQELERERSLGASRKSEYDVQQMTIQKLTAERNSFRQKCESIAKEMGRICKHGRTIRQVEKILADDSARREEVEYLREQKRQALAEVEQLRAAYQQARAAQHLAGDDTETTKVLERNVQLECLLTNMTEYVNAKEMQLETYKEVNAALLAELQSTHVATLNKNLDEHDV